MRRTGELIHGGDGGDWDFDISPSEGDKVDLDGSHPDVVDESYVVLTRRTSIPRYGA